MPESFPSPMTQNALRRYRVTAVIRGEDATKRFVAHPIAPPLTIMQVDPRDDHNR